MEEEGEVRGIIKGERGSTRSYAKRKRKRIMRKESKRG